jgi:hypothetical protein
MSKLSSFVVAVVLAALLGAGVALVAAQPGFSWAALAGQSGAGAAAGRKTATTAAEVEATTGELLTKVSELRGLKVLRPVKSGVKSRAEIEQTVVRAFDESSTPEEIETSRKTMTAFGLLPKGFALREFMVRLLTEQVAGFYEPKTKEFFLADWNSLEAQKMVMAHELTHVLQDQHFDLRRFEKWPDGDGDREMAIHALIEGDATALMVEYTIKPFGLDLTRLPLSALKDMSSQAGGPGMDVLASAPRAIREALIFPYAQGLIFAQSVVKERGWSGVSRAFAELPDSTEQVMHPHKYLAREKPVKVELADLAPTLGKGWRRIDADVSGEYGYYLALAEFISKENAEAAAAGWGGDQYALYENAAGEWLLAHLSAWDAEADAEEFFEAYAARSRKRYADFKEAGAGAADVRRAVTGEGGLRLERRGPSVLVIEGLRAGQSKRLDEVAAKLWQSKSERPPR